MQMGSAPQRSSKHTVKVENVKLDLFIHHFDPTVKPPLFMLHAHSYPELFVCVKEQLGIILENSTITLHPGEAIIIPANTKHARVLTDTPHCGCSVGIMLTHHGGNKHQDLYTSLSRICFVPQIRLYTDVQFLCDGVMSLNTMSNTPEYYPALKVLLLLTELSNMSISEHRKPSHTPLPDNAFDYVLQLDRIINREFHLPLTAEEIAKRLFISPRQLVRIVERCYGTTLHRVLNEKRMETAARLLKESDIEIGEIADQVGFASKTGFYRAFQKHYGISPSAFRQNTKNHRLE